MDPDTRTIREDLNVEAALAELDEKLPELAEVTEPENPGMHITDTVDFDVVLYGKVWLELNNGAEAHLKAGDCVVQNGTRHALRNKSLEPCVIAATSMGAHRGA